MADIALANTRGLAELRERQEANFIAMDLLSQRTETIAIAVERLADVQLQTLQRIDQMQSEIRGLQTENRRILDILSGQQENDT